MNRNIFWSESKRFTKILKINFKVLVIVLSRECTQLGNNVLYCEVVYHSGDRCAKAILFHPPPSFSTPKEPLLSNMTFNFVTHLCFEVYRLIQFWIYARNSPNVFLIYFKMRYDVTWAKVKYMFSNFFKARSQICGNCKTNCH